MDGKVALEEHYSTAQNNKTWDAKREAARNGQLFTQDIESRLMDPVAYLKEMDQAGIELSILSLTSPGIQSVENPKEAIELARSCNEYVHFLIKKNSDRFSGFAAVPIQDPKVASQELERAVNDFGFKGALINGYSNIGPNEEVRYLDEEPVWSFWETVSQLNVPIYLHPREPLPSQQRAIRGYPELGGSAWGFGLETSTHAVRLMLSGIFDEFPNVQIILGHLGEGLSFLLPRLQHRLDLQRDGERGAKAKHRPSYYFGRNFYVTTSGHFHVKQLRELISQIGMERVLFSTDYPYEHVHEAAHWFDDLELENDLKVAIGRGNANRLFSFGLPEITEGNIVGSAS